MLTSQQLREKYLNFFKSKNHAVIPSASVIPENDPTVLFTTAGMHPLVPYLLGQPHPAGNRLTNVQKCIRTGDIEEVGDLSHLTFFEMLGNWSLGDYFKEHAIAWSYEFLTSSVVGLGINPKKLAVTVFAGEAENNILPDDKAANIWKSFGVPEHKIAYLPRKNNWWGPAGQTGPCGPDTEMFYWIGEGEFPPENSNPGNDENNWLEIWNDVFMQYRKTEEGKYEPLAQQNVDTGMGLERTVAKLNNLVDVYQIDTFWAIIQKIQEISGKEYTQNKEVTCSMRIIADHIRTATMIMGDDRGVGPSNVDQGYIVRRLLRRAIRHGRVLGIKDNFCLLLAEVVIQMYGETYPEVVRNKDFVLTEIAREENKFRNTIEQGLKEFDKWYRGPVDTSGLKTDEEINERMGLFPKKMPGQVAFNLFTTHGFPIELTLEISKEHGITVDLNDFYSLMREHQEKSRAGAEQKFAGGLADHSEISTKYHTATHLLHATLQRVLGSHAVQRGSNITQERMRFDFSHPEKVTPEQLRQVEDLVNSAIQKNYTVTWQEMSFEEAKEKGAIGLFEDKYQPQVKVYTVGDTKEKAFADPSSATYSREVCGGPHVEHTGTMGKFKITKEEAVSAGVRRIKAILE